MKKTHLVNLLTAAVLVLLAVVAVVLLLPEETSVTNLLDEYYVAIASGGHSLPKELDTLYDNDILDFKKPLQAYGIHAYTYNAPHLSNAKTVKIIANEHRKTVKFIYYEADCWYRYLYNANEKTLSYATNDRSHTERNDFLFTFILPDYLEENENSAYSFDSLGNWNGEQYER